MSRHVAPRRLTTWMVLLAALSFPALARMGTVEGLRPAELFPGARFDPSVPTQEQRTGVRPGSRPLRHGEILAYFEALAEASPRATLVTYARSHEDRRLVLLAVGDERTIAGLEAFREAHAARMDPRRHPEDRDAALAETSRAVAWMAYGIHGDELSSTDAAAAVAYWLVAGEDERAARLRKELVILIDPLENPDGRERFLAQTTAFAHARPNPDTDDLSHTTVWPWGRGNHYLFDLNRDWFTLVHPESRRSELIALWNPQLMVDSHEMGAHDTYLFSPARHPFNPHLPDNADRWARRFAKDQAGALDARGYPYYTREWNEEFFPGYGSSWASYLGAVGILYEMSSTEGTVVKQRPGTTRTYAQAVEQHVASSVANLETLAANRKAILKDYLASRRAAIRAGRTGPVRAWIFPPGRLPDRAARLAGLLRREGIEVLRAGAPVENVRLVDARTGERVTRTLPAGTWMVPLDQPAAPLARVLLDPHVPMDPEFLREEREYLERGKGSRLYETTAWSLPLAYGLDALWAAERPRGTWEEADAPAVEGRFEPSDASSAVWIFDGSRDGSSGALADLLQQRVAVRIAGKPFAVAGRSYDRGALLVRREGNPGNIASRLETLAARWKIDVHVTDTALAEDGPDLGGRLVHPLVPPRVGVWSGMPVSPSGYGAVWHLFDQVVDLRFSGLDLANASSLDWSRYNVLVFPPVFDGPDAYRHALGRKGLERLRRWVESGGTAIGLGSGSEFLADEDTGLTRIRRRRQALEDHPPAVLGLDALAAEAAGPFDATGLRPARAAADDEDGAGPADSRTRRSPYDVAPVIGAGARPFLAGLDVGTPAGTDPVAAAAWIAPVLPAGRDEANDEDLRRVDRRLRRFAPQGTFLRVELDTELWPAWGLPGEIAVWTRGSAAFVARPPVQVAGRYAGVGRLHLGGLLWPEGAGRIARTAYLSREAVGRGQVIVFQDHPAYRGWMHDSRRLFLNTVLTGPGLGTNWSNPW